MANNYFQIPIQFIFAPKLRSALLLDPWREQFHKYVTGIVQNNGHKLLQVNSLPDHVHLFISMHPAQSCSDLMKKVKGSSSHWINENGFLTEKFNWQSGFGAFSYGKSQIAGVVRYIQNQQLHHRKETFLEEYKKFLHCFGIEYDSRFIFHEPA
jgi:REP element-mobilizing transposase RayT